MQERKDLERKRAILTPRKATHAKMRGSRICLGEKVEIEAVGKNGACQSTLKI